MMISIVQHIMLYPPTVRATTNAIFIFRLPIQTDRSRPIPTAHRKTIQRSVNPTVHLPSRPTVQPASRPTVLPSNRSIGKRLNRQNSLTTYRPGFQIFFV